MSIIAGGGFAMMAMKLAEDRSGFFVGKPNETLNRAFAVANPCSCTAEYYRIIDHAEHAWCARNVADRWTV